LGSNFSAVYRAVNPPTLNGAEASAVTQDPLQTDTAKRLADHERRLEVLEAFVAVLQRQSAVQGAAQHGAELLRGWDDPADAKSERWNLWLPRALKRCLEAQARTAGIAPSQLVQRLLLAALHGSRRGEGDR
jgi:hypothetical protein